MNLVAVPWVLGELGFMDSFCTWVLVPWKNPWLPLFHGLILVSSGGQTCRQSILYCQPHPQLRTCSVVGQEMGIFPIPDAVSGVLGLLFP